MAIVSEYRDPCGAHVIIRDDDYAHKPPSQKRAERTAANAVILGAFTRGYYARQAECARQYNERLMGC